MIGRRKTPDGLPFRLYPRYGKHKVSFAYKLPNGKWAYRLSAPAHNKEAIAEIRKQAIERAEALNGDAVEPGTVEALFERYFSWQYGLPLDSELRKASSTLEENDDREKIPLIKVFGKMSPTAIKPKHVYGYLDKRAQQGAPAKANKEIALLSAVLEYGRRRGDLEVNPCRGIKYNPTRPREKVVGLHELDLAVEVARQRRSSDGDTGASVYLIAALCTKAAYLTVSRPTEMRALLRQAIGADGVTVPIGKRKKGAGAEKQNRALVARPARDHRRSPRAAAHDEPVCFWQHVRPALHAQRLEHELVAPDGLLREGRRRARHQIRTLLSRRHAPHCRNDANGGRRRPDHRRDRPCRRAYGAQGLRPAPSTQSASDPIGITRSCIATARMIERAYVGHRTENRRINLKIR